jgi:hypothetical protein
MRSELLATLDAELSSEGVARVFEDCAGVTLSMAGRPRRLRLDRLFDHLAAAPIGFDEASGNFQRTSSTTSTPTA